MNLKPGMKVLDACAAPGMKTLAIASRLNNNCTLYANDMDAKRYRTMKTFLLKFGVKTAKQLNVDFSQLDPVQYQDLDIILLDPSCSGSGISRRFDYGQEQNEEEIARTQRRWQKLAKFQLVLLESSLKFFPEKIVYCTCSHMQQENEDVINQLFQNNPDIQYQVIDPMPSWPSRGIGDYEFSSRCLRADQDSTLTSGFFCCVLQRKESAVQHKPIALNATVKQKEQRVKELNTETKEIKKQEKLIKVEVRQSPKKNKRKLEQLDDIKEQIDEVISQNDDDSIAKKKKRTQKPKVEVLEPMTSSQVKSNLLPTIKSTRLMRRVSSDQRNTGSESLKSELTPRTLRTRRLQK